MDNQNFVNPGPVAPWQVPKKKNEYTIFDTIIAFLVFPVSFFFVRAVDASHSPLGWMLSSFILCALSLVYLKKSGVRLSQNKFSVISLSAALLLSLSIIFTSNKSLQSTVASIVVLIYLYTAFSVTGNSAEKHPSSLFPLEMLKAVLIMPLGSLFCCFEALSTTKKSKKIGKNLLLILAGLAIAFIPTVIVLALLSYDEGFEQIVNRMFDFGDFDPVKLIADLILTLPLALYIFGALYSGKNKRFGDILCAEKCNTVSEKIRFAPIVLVCSAVAPFIIIYSVFFLSQLDYYLSAFSGVLPEGLSYADYARDGFFQLSAVSTINALMILCTSVFSKHNTKRDTPIALKIANTVLSFLTLILIATAISKMVLYIGIYGLTIKRVLSSAFMVFLAVVFIALLIKQFAKKTNVILTALITAVLICGTLAFADVNGVIASYNTDRYLSGTLEDFDINILTELDAPGIIALDRIAEKASDTTARTLSKSILTIMSGDRLYEERSVFSFSIPDVKAKKILDKYRN